MKQGLIGLVGYLFISIFLVSCQNPFNEAGSSTVDVDYNILLRSPGEFSFFTPGIHSEGVTLSWTVSEQAETFQVKYGTVSGNYSILADCNSSPCTINGLNNNTTYYFIVVASNPRGTRMISSELALTPAPVSPPLAPSFLTAEGGNSQIRLEWDPSWGEGSISYEVLRSSSSGSGFATVASSLVATTYTDSSIQNGTTYYYKIRARNVAGSAPLSSEVSAQGMSSFSVNNITISGANALQISWTNSQGADGYTVNYGTNPGVYSHHLPHQTSPAIVTGLNPGTTYYFLVSGQNFSGSLAASSEVSGIPLGSFSMTGLLPTNGFLTANWTSSTGASSYDVLYDTTSQILTGSYTNTLSNKVSGIQIPLEAGNTYFVRVRARNAYGSIFSTNELSDAPYISFNHNIPFTALTSGNYIFSDSDKAELFNGVLRLTPSDQTDNSDSGFSGTIYTGTLWDPLNGYLRLSTTTNHSELDASWTPKWSNLTGYWTLNGSGELPSEGTVDARKGINGTDNGAGGSLLSQVSGKLHSGLYFSPTNQRVVNIGNGEEYDYGETSFTVSYWIKFDTGTTNPNWSVGKGQGYVACAGGSPLASGGWGVAHLSANDPIESILLYLSDGSNCIYSPVGESSVPRGKWVHLVVKVDRENQQASLYVDGRESTFSISSLGSISDTISSFRYLSIGRGADSIANGVTIDDFAIWDTALTSGEIQLIFERQGAKYAGMISSRIMDAWSTLPWTSLRPVTTLPFSKELPALNNGEDSTDYSEMSGDLESDLAGLWHLNEATGANSILDSSGNAYHGIPSSGLSLEERGILGNAAKFNGTTTSVALPASSTILPGNTSFTISVWFKNTKLYTTADANVGARFVTFLRLASSSKIGFGVSGDGTERLMAVYSTASGVANKKMDCKLADGNWHHAVVTYSHLTQLMTIYCDALASTSTNASTILSASIHNASIGKYDNRGFFLGHLDELAVWKRELSSLEVKQLYLRGASRIKYQIRTCFDDDCGDQDLLVPGRGWKGPDNTFESYFSELHNNTDINALGKPTGAVMAGPLNLNFSNFVDVGLNVSPQRYFQYRAFLESDDGNHLCQYEDSAAPCSPELKSISVGPQHFARSYPTVTSKVEIGTLFQVLDANGFHETLGSNGCIGARYTLSIDGSSFYYFNGLNWVLSSDSYATASSSAMISSNLFSLVGVMGTGTIQVKTYLASDGLNACEIDNLQITGQKY